MQRQAVKGAVILTVGVTLMGLTSTPMNRLVEVQKDVRQLFLDGEITERMEGLQRVVHQPQKHPANPVIEGTNPWERAAVSVYGTVLYDGAMKRFRMWYLCIPGPHPWGCSGFTMRAQRARLTRSWRSAGTGFAGNASATGRPFCLTVPKGRSMRERLVRA